MSTPPNALDRRARTRAATASSLVTSPRDRQRRRRRAPRPRLGAPSLVEVERDDAGARGGERVDDRAADAAGARR